MPQPRSHAAPPTSTYRLQISAELTLDDAAALCGHLAALGVSHVYLSPLLQAVPGSAHGYDVVAHDRINAEAGGDAALARFAEAMRAHGLRAVLDVVPNHMAVPTPLRLNAPLWDYLTYGDDSAYAHWFDVDTFASRAVLMPVLGAPLGDVLARGELTLDRSGEAPVLRYYEHEFPVEPGTADGVGDSPEELEGLLRDQNYRLAYWRVAAEELDYRRFFDVTTLIGVRVEAPDVFLATHELVLARVADGTFDGLRIDHPDGLADPGEYVGRLAAAAPGAWIVVEKILEPGEHLPGDWPCAGTTGYDAMRELGGLFVDRGAADAMTRIYTDFTGEPGDFAAVVRNSKQLVVDRVLVAEVERLVRLAQRIAGLDARYADRTPTQWREAIRALLCSFDVYRAYVEPGAPAPDESVQRVDAAVADAKGQRPDLAEVLDLLADLALASDVERGAIPARELKAEFCTRLQQTTGPVMAKGVEDTAFYRYHRLVSLNEVGGDPGEFGVDVEEFHEHARARQREWPLSMTSLSTHDTKRSEDVRARISVLSEIPEQWAELVREVSGAAAAYRSPAGPDRNAEYLFWQTVVGAWPIDPQRAAAYMEKATREAKQRTAWVDGDEAYDAALRAFVEGVLGDAAIVARVDDFVRRRLLVPGRMNSLAQKAVQLTMPGVPDVYQGSECWDLSLVDPDNRRPVAHALRRRLLQEPAASLPPLADDDVGRSKLLVTARALQLRREHPEWFGADGDYEPLAVTGTHRSRVVAFSRAGAVATVVPRLAATVEEWGDTCVTLGSGSWQDVLSGEVHDGGEVPVASLWRSLPVALLVRREGHK